MELALHTLDADCYLWGHTSYTAYPRYTLLFMGTYSVHCVLYGDIQLGLHTLDAHCYLRGIQLVLPTLDTHCYLRGIQLGLHTLDTHYYLRRNAACTAYPI